MNGKLDSKCGRTRRCHEGVDRLSQLPNDVLLSILSILPLKEAASTSVLSTRWSDLWRHTPTLNLCGKHLCGSGEWNRYMRTPKIRVASESSCDVLTRKYIERVNSALKSHKGPHLKEFKICFPLHQSAHCAVTKWLEFAFSRRVEVLELNFSYYPDYSRKNYVILEDVMTEMSSINLKSLFLNSLNVSGEAIRLLLRNCPLLEQLTIESAFLTSDLEVCGGALKHLSIKNCGGENCIKIYAPNLTSLRINSGTQLFYINAPKLVSAYFGCMRSVKQYEVLSSISAQLTTFKPTVFPKDQFPQMPKLRELTVTYYGRKIDAQPLHSLLLALPSLEELKIKNYLESSTKEEHGVKDVNVKRFQHPHLRVLKFEGVNVGLLVDMMSYILDTCVALQKIFVQVYATGTRHGSCSSKAAREKIKQLVQSNLPTHIQLIMDVRTDYLV